MDFMSKVFDMSSLIIPPTPPAKRQSNLDKSNGTRPSTNNRRATGMNANSTAIGYRDHALRQK
jgi:hypothetical protein